MSIKNNNKENIKKKLFALKKTEENYCYCFFLLFALIRELNSTIKKILLHLCIFVSCHCYC